MIPDEGKPGARGLISHRASLLALVTIALGAFILRVADLSQVPPGLHFDQAADGILGLEIFRGQTYPVFFQSYTGREALFMYVIAAMYAIVGPGIIGLRLAGAVCAVVTVIGLAFLGAALFNRRIGLLAAAIFAGLYWDLHISRLGERTEMVPTLDVLAMLALWSGFRRRSPLVVALGGALTGLQLDTYPSSRFFPIALGIVGVIELFVWIFGDSGGLVGRGQNEAGSPPDSALLPITALATVAILSGALFAAPLAIHFLHYPGDLLGRAGQVAIWNQRVAGSSPLAALATSTGRTLGMFLFHGDADWKYNLAGRPVFDPVSGALFVLGLVVAFWRGRRASSSAERLCLVWWLVMLVPGFLSVDSPQFMRTLGAAPAAALFVAIGLDVVVRRASSAPAPLVRRLGPALLAWPVLAGALAAYQYFAVWAPSAAAYLALEGDVTAAAQIIQAQSPAYPVTYVASRYGPDPTESFLDGSLFGQLRWFDGRSALPLPPPGAGPVLYVLPRTATDSYWYHRLPVTARTALVNAPDGGPAVEAFRLTSGSLGPASGILARPVDAGGIAQLEAAEIPRGVEAGDPIAPALFWKIDQKPSEQVKFFVHLVDSTGQAWAQYDEVVYPVADWQPGQILVVRRPVLVPSFIPLGRYRLQIGIERLDGQALAMHDGQGKPRGTFWQSPLFDVIRPAHPPTSIPLAFAAPADAIFGGALHLVGTTIGASTIQDGDTVLVTLYWKVLHPPAGDLQTVLRAQNAAGATIAQASRPPTGGVWPAHEWQAGDVIVDRQTLLIPAGTSAGQLTLQVGLVDSNGHALATTGLAAPLAAIGAITLKARPHQTVNVRIGHSQAVVFTNGVRLLGYNLDQTRATPGQAIHLTLYWQAKQPLSTSWTVFTHLLDSRVQIQAQEDSIPAHGQRPTQTWAPGETIVDAHALVVQPNAAPGQDRLEIGLYDARSGQRLKTTTGDDQVLLDQVITVGH